MNEAISFIALVFSSLALALTVRNAISIYYVRKHEFALHQLIDCTVDTVKQQLKVSSELARALKEEHNDRPRVRDSRTTRKTRSTSNRRDSKTNDTKVSE